MRTYRKTILLGALLCGGLGVFGSPAMAQDAAGQGTTDLRQEVAALKAEIAELRRSQDRNWLNERRAEEVKALVRDVLNDAETRASLGGGVMAGHDGKHFFLKSADDAFSMEIAGQVQFRYIANFRDDEFVDDNFDGIDDNIVDETDSGFQLRRTKLNFSGHVASPKFGYDITLAVDREDGTVVAEDVMLSYKLADDLKISIGKFKIPFLREELTSSKRQLAVDRSVTTEHFTLDRAEQVQLEWTPNDWMKLTGSISDGSDSGFTTYNADQVEAAVTGRVDVKLAGDWGQAKDIASWSGEEFAAFVGGAIHHQWADAGGANPNEFEDYTSWTIDGSAEMNGAAIYLAYMGATADTSPAGREIDDHGFLVQGSYQIVPKTLEPFIRYEYLDADNGGGDTDDTSIITAGINWYHNKHNAKFTFDVVYVTDPMPARNRYTNNNASDGLGLRGGSEDEEVALSAQYQLLF